MLCGSERQRDLFEGRSVADAGLARHLRRGTTYYLLAKHGDRLFPDELFVGLYSADRGRPAVAPSVLTKPLVLKYYNLISDAEVVERGTYEYRWCVVNNTVLDEQPFAKSTFQLFRTRLFVPAREVSGAAEVQFAPC